MSLRDSVSPLRPTAGIWLVAFVSLAIGVVAAQNHDIPTPAEHFGQEIGDPGVLILHRGILDYYRVLEANSDRVRIKIVGETTEGRPFYYAIVSSPENLSRLDELMAMNAKLYDPRGVSEAEAERIIREGKTFVVANHQIHSTEVGASQGAILLAHRLAAGDDHEVRRILDNVVLVHVPVHNPDGQEMVYEWLARWRGTEFQNSSPPFLYQKYVGHDNNRDWYMFTQAETKLSVVDVQNVFHPQFTLDQHQMGSQGARIFVPPFEDPWEPNVDSALVASNNMIGTYMGQYLIAHGLSGVEWKIGYDAWTPARAYYHLHGGVRILTEVASANYADAIEIDPGRMNERHQRVRWNFPMVWPGGTWSLKDIVKYHYISSMAAMLAAADLREPLLRGMYAAQLRSVHPPEGTPYAFVVPTEQVDSPTAVKMLEVLRVGDVEVERAAAAPFTAGGRRYSAGTYVVRVAQPAGRFAKTVLERQEYPRLFQYPGGPLDPPYDVTAHTLPLLMNVRVDTIAAPFEAELRPVEQPEVEPGNVVAASGGTDVSAYLLDPRVNNSYAAAAKLAGSGLTRVSESFRAGGREWPAGTFVLRTPPSASQALEVRRQLEELTERLGIDAVGVAEIPDVPFGWVGPPSVAIYQSYSPSMPEGWFRFVLDSYEIPYDILHWDDIREGDLSPYGVIFLPPGGGSPLEVVEGRGAGSEQRFRPYGPTPAEYAGGIGEEGVAALEQFVEEGGVLFTWSGAWRFLAEYMGVAAAAVNDGLAATEFNIPGSLLRVSVDTDNPLGYGLEPETAIFFWRDSAWPIDVPGAEVVARYPAGDLLMSGWIQGEDYLVNQAAMLEIPRGRGRMVMTGFYPEYRGQAYLTYRLLFNAIFYPRAESDR